MKIFTFIWWIKRGVLILKIENIIQKFLQKNNKLSFEKDGYIANRLYNESFGVVPAFTVGSVLVSDNVSNGCYDFIFNEITFIKFINLYFSLMS